jgi:alkylation response protein AidB-like acyl-CoA dehydrogenase
VNFDLDEDQRLLQATVERFVADAYAGDVERRRHYLAEPAGFSAVNWRALADLGLLALPFRAPEGGLGGGPVELIVAAEALGRGLVVEPWLDAVVIAGSLLDRAGTPAQRAEWLPQIMAGGARLALAHAERTARYELGVVGAIAQPTTGGYALSGGKTFVLHGPEASAYIVSARDERGIGFFLVPVAAKGVEARRYTLVDGTPAHELTFHAVQVPAEARLAGGLEALEDVAATAALAASAEMLGLMSLLFDTTLAYAKTRRQFGVPIGSFQVLQHRLVDAYAAVEQARSMLYRAALASPAAPGWRQQTAGAKAFVSEAAIAVGHTAIQIHGGMGMTDELLVGHAHKRILLLATLFGDPAAQLRRYRQAA